MESAFEYDDAAGLLRWAGQNQRIAAQAEAHVLAAAVDWAGFHSEDSIVPAAEEWEGAFPLAGEGTPEVAEFAIAEFAAVLGVSTEAGRALIGDALELAHRLPKTYARVVAGTLPVWRARKIAQSTTDLPPAGAAYVDRHVHAFAHSISFAALGRLVEEARVRFDPEEARRRREAAAENRRVSIHMDRVGSNGTVDLTGTLDLKDAADLDAAIARRAGFLAQTHPELSLDVRRSLALGEMARVDLGLDLATGERGTGPGRAGGGVELRVHVDADTLAAAMNDDRADDSIAGTDQGDLDAVGRVVQARLVRVEKTRSFIHLTQLREWLARPDLKVSIRPVIDTAATLRTDRYEIPDRFREHVIERDGTCRFPHCNRPARSSDIDHIEPFDHSARDGTGDTGPPGQTSTDNLAPGCRHHHRLKTHGGWSYRMLEPGYYLWTSPHGHRFLVTPPARNTSELR